MAVKTDQTAPTLMRMSIPEDFVTIIKARETEI